MIGCMLILPAALGAMGLVRVKAAQLGLLGGVLVITGYICYFAMLFQGYATIALHQQPRKQNSSGSAREKYLEFIKRRAELNMHRDGSEWYGHHQTC